ncbi:cysteine proteinase [Melanomma pulvis-pyrius CBS 109.77]|uniref:Cysteine proteinase n=1 Tax=Melanomma pulvis-pyrius CBS 109.77 TaxID=1314802 RepID=A0A6A6WXX5_9PLEO|nr:cysteine proteinase [Melanomma pulvis-pyrius CBS 109.77]
MSGSHGPDGWRGSDGAGDPRGHAASQPHPPLADVVASATEKVKEFRPYPIKSLLDTGKSYLFQAKIGADARGGKPAGAYWSYIVAYQIVVEAIPRHPDYYDKIDSGRGQLHREWKDLIKELNACEQRFVNIKNMIVTDNKRNGVQSQPIQPASRPLSSGSLYTTRTAAPASQSSQQSNGSAFRRDDELMLPDVPSMPPIGRSSPAEPSRRKPQVQPKPQSLHGRSLHQSTTSLNGLGATNDLADRFARLRGAAAPLDTGSDSSGPDPSVNMPSPSEYQSSSRPSGPRDMPPPPQYPLQHPPKLHMNTQLATSMPKEPSPTYSPARNLSMPASINPPRSTARSMVGTGGRSNSMASSVSAHAPNSTADSDSYFPAQPKAQEISTLRRKSTQKPLELQITAERLYDYVRMYDVLIVDVRSREEFDGGHIYVRAIMCVEPAALQDGLSAEQLHDRLILSPDEEQGLYERRNEFELVVYHDDSTKNASFLQNPSRNEREQALKRLYDTLYEFNAEKPLKRPPIFLMGGIDAWIDLVGTQSLKMSSTASIVNGPRGPTRAIKRVPVANYNPRISLPKRRTREYTSMDPEEEQKWLEEARKGRAVLESPALEDGNDDDMASPVYRTTEDFLRRYPEVEVEQQSMRYPPSRPPTQNQYMAPSIPAAPSRPAPSVPRMSYSGVHERQAAPQGRPAQLPVYVSPGRYGQIGLHKTGLINFGVTCYMNSVIQCLSANSGLTDIFLSQRYARDLQKDNWKGSKGILPEAYATLVTNMYKGDVNNLRPTTFRRVCGHFGRQWGIDQQQDAKEFLEFLLDMLHEDHNVAWNRSLLRPLTEADEMVRERLPRTYAARLEWNRYQHRDMSLIGSLFAGQHASQLTCSTCGFTSTTYEAFWSISVEIPHDRPADIRDCLRSYCSAERLSGDEVWRCTRCKKDREAIKKITITRAPDTLVVHFKRFSASRTQGARKIRTPIHFPLDKLDLGPFVQPPITPEEEAYVMANSADAAAQLAGLKTDPAMNGPYTYNAYAVIWHIGQTLGSGHYIAMVRDKTRGCWRQFNDDKISDFSPEKMSHENRLQNEKAYIVFYERERVPGGMF